MTPEEWGRSVVGGLGLTERAVHMEIVKLTAHAVREARRDALEEAAKVADRYDPDGCGVIAAAIRALQKDEGE